MKIYREITPLEETDVFVILDSYNNTFDYPIHNHAEFELNLILGSSGTRIVGDSTELFYIQDLVLIGPYLFHKWDIDISKRQGKYPSRVITIQFRKDLFNSQFFQKSQFCKIRKLLQDVSRGIKFHGKTFDKAKKMVQRLTKNKGFFGIIEFLQLLNLLSNSKETTFLASEGFSSNAVLSKSNRIQIAYGYILKNFQKNEETDETSIRWYGASDADSMSCTSPTTTGTKRGRSGEPQRGLPSNTTTTWSHRCKIPSLPWSSSTWPSTKMILMEF